MSDDSVQLFAEHRSLLFTVVYEMLGSAADAEDVVQEVWVRWAAANAGRDDGGGIADFADGTDPVSDKDLADGSGGADGAERTRCEGVLNGAGEADLADGSAPAFRSGLADPAHAAGEATPGGTAGDDPSAGAEPNAEAAEPSPGAVADVDLASARTGDAATEAFAAGPGQTAVEASADGVSGADASAADVSGADVSADPIRHPRAYLVRIATRLALNRLRTLARRREDYIGPWLPEPVRTVPDVIDDVLLSESVSLAMLVVLESLAPAERAVFVLREVFGYDFGEIADAVDRTPAAVRQIAHRAREHVQARRPRYDTDARTVQAVMASFQRTLFSGDIQGLMDLMAPDVVLLNDGGGKRKAARRPVVGASNVAHFLVGIGQKAAGELRIEEVQVNGARAWSIYLDGEIYGVTQLVIHDGRIAQLFMVANPDKLTAMGTETALTL